jgi:hypothetical protein
MVLEQGMLRQCLSFCPGRMAADLGIPQQSVALTAAIGTSQALALSGTLDVLTGSLTLLEMTSESTALGNSYSQTRVATTLYNRYDACLMR